MLFPILQMCLNVYVEQCLSFSLILSVCMHNAVCICCGLGIGSIVMLQYMPYSNNLIRNIQW